MGPKAKKTRRATGTIEEQGQDEAPSGLQEIIDVVPHFIFAKDADGNYLFANRALAQAYGTTTSDLIGKSDKDYNASHEQVNKFQTDDMEVLRGRLERIDTEEPITLANGEQRVLQTTKVPLRYKGERAVLGASVDITRLKAAEAERLRLARGLLETERLESLGLLAGGIAHDFNNLLAVISANVEMLVDRNAAGSVERGLLEMSLTATQQASELCHQMLAYAGRGEVLKEATSLNDLVEPTVEVVRAQYDSNVSVHLELSPNSPVVLGDASQLRQVARNLLTNALNAVGEGGDIWVRTGSRYLDHDDLGAVRFLDSRRAGSYAVLEVEDSGMGMTPDVKRKLFEPFFSTRRGGHGLGMAAIMGIVRRHNGGILVRSEPGQGARITVLIPQRSGARAALPLIVPTNQRGRSSGNRILVADDTVDVTDGVRRLLAGAGYDVTVVHDGRDAVNAVHANPHQFDAVILDVTMDVVSGPDALRAIRAVRPNMVAVFIGGRVGIEAAICEEFKCGFLAKPFRPHELIALVRQQLPLAPLVP